MKVCKLLIITDTYVGIPGGSERHLLNFLTNVSDKFDVSVIQLNPDGNPYQKNLSDALAQKVNLKTYPLSSLRSVMSIWVLLKIYLTVLFKRPNVVISYHEKSDLINLLLSYCPFTSHKTVSSKRDMGLKLEGRLGDVMKRFNRRFTAITAPSNSIIDMVVNNFDGPKDRAFSIHNGVDLATYGKQEVPSDSIKKKLGLPLDKTIIISVGWLRPGKGHEYVIKAMANMENNSAYVFVILGEGPDRERLLKLADDLGVGANVQLVGMQNNVSEWLSVSDIAISASFSEGLSNALVEAAASGLPIIATNVGGNPEVVEDGYNGILIDPKDYLSIKHAIEYICKKDTHMLEMGENSRKKAEKEFSIHGMVKSLENLYLDISGMSNARS